MLIPNKVNSFTTGAKHLGGQALLKNKIDKDSFDHPLISHSKINDLCQ